MANELTYDIVMPEGVPLRFRFNGLAPDLAFTIRTDYSLKETKKLSQLSDKWQRYFEQPVERETDADTKRAKDVMYQIIEISAEDFDHAAFTEIGKHPKLGEATQIKIFTIVGKTVRDQIDTEPATDSESSYPNEDSVDRDQQNSDSPLQPLQAPMAANLANG